jgi:hypothetical protein
VDRIARPILLPIRSGGGHGITRPHEPRHHGIYGLEEDLDDRALVDRYDPGGRNGFRPAPGSRIARARVTA